MAQTFQSSSIHIFPSSNRIVHQEDNYVTQNNLVTVIRKLVGTDSFVVSDSLKNGISFCFFIGGYYIELLNSTASTNGFKEYVKNFDPTESYYAHIILIDNYISGNESSNGQTFLTIDTSETMDRATYNLLLVEKNKIPLSSRTINTLTKVDDGLLSDLE